MFAPRVSLHVLAGLWFLLSLSRTSSGSGIDSDLHAIEQRFIHLLGILSIHVIFNWIIVVILLLSCLSFVQFVGCHHSVISWLLPLGLGFAFVASTFGCYP